jgi:hypothetical protein
VILNEDFEDSRVLETSDYKKSGSKRDFISSKVKNIISSMNIGLPQNR